MIPWLWQFLRYCQSHHSRAISQALASLLRHAEDEALNYSELPAPSICWHDRASYLFIPVHLVTKTIRPTDNFVNNYWVTIWSNSIRVRSANSSQRLPVVFHMAMSTVRVFT